MRFKVFLRQKKFYKIINSLKHYKLLAILKLKLKNSPQSLQSPKPLVVQRARKPQQEFQKVNY